MRSTIDKTLSFIFSGGEVTSTIFKFINNVGSKEDINILNKHLSNKKDFNNEEIDKIISVISTYQPKLLEIEENIRKITHILSFSKLKKKEDSDIVDILKDPETFLSDNRDELINTNIKSLDKLLQGGIRPGELVIIAGRPGCGKTTLAIQLMKEVSSIYTEKSLYFTLEMTKKQILQRLVCNYFNIPYENILDAVIRSNKLKEMGKMDLSIKTYSSLNGIISYIEDSSDTLKIVFIDHLQLINVNNTSSKYQELSKITQKLKKTALELNIPIVALSQLSRESEKKDFDSLSDMSGSGTIEQDADVIITLRSNGSINLIKNRRGPIGFINTVFIKERFTFKE